MKLLGGGVWLDDMLNRKWEASEGKITAKSGTSCFDHKGGSSRHLRLRFLVHTVFFQRLAPGAFWGGTWMQMVCIGFSRGCPCCLPF